MTRCSFCGRPNSEVKHMVQSVGAAICNDCIKLCAGVVALEDENSRAKRDAAQPGEDAE